jgi:hypothetical protein
LKEQAARERAKLEAIRDKMINEMRAQGVNPRYLAEMESLDISKLQRV